MAKLSYHITILESAMADMQRAFNSKRSIAEVALTRMCDARTVSSIESLVLRMEELEKTVSMLKLGVPLVSQNTIVENKEEANEKATVAPSRKEKNIQKIDDIIEQKYDSWDYILGRISELKHSLRSGLSSAKVYKKGNLFIICLNEIFYRIFASNANDVELIRGLIAEREKTNRENIVIEFKVSSKNDDCSYSDLDDF